MRPAYRLHRAAAAATVRRLSVRVSNINIERLERLEPGPLPPAARKYIPVFSALLSYRIFICNINLSHQYPHIMANSMRIRCNAKCCKHTYTTGVGARTQLLATYTNTNKLRFLRNRVCSCKLQKNAKTNSFQHFINYK